MQEQKQNMHWNIPEFHEHKRSRRWYIIAVAAMALLLLYAVLSSNFLFAIILIVVGITMALHDKHGANEVKFELLENGIAIGEKHYSYNSIKNFWIFYEPDEAKMLFFEFKNGIRPRLSIPLLNKNPLKVRSILLQNLPEAVEKENEPLSEQLTRLLKL
ncbi:hypothetical protein CL632_03900 [bacterium]|jgi:hypothetical protein|nr:hypothetical protein [bacterium]MDP6571809.1 hypothetical protein [Patescibacteria group bacterium]MDP6756341.1 hypothetical protein [Patescibacteria group bacterium]|tara:strand:+ start:7335 stop:7811 length:477 start_codon:yes stop_codon:yes gene_type:complete